MPRRGVMRIAEAIRAAASTLSDISDTARLDAELLMAHALGVERSAMLVRQMDDPAPDTFATLVQRRAACEPIAHILGAQEFYGRSFAVSRDVLIPRGDSETLIDAALAFAPAGARVLDLGTGSGALLITAVLEIDDAHGTGIDASPSALRIAQRNAQQLGVIGARARFLARDWTKDGWPADLGTFDLILCNPPYVEEDAELSPQVRDYEPARALFAGTDGLADYRVLMPQLRALMNEGALAMFEIGYSQADAVTALARSEGFVAQLRHDLANRPRCVICR
ncbi:MAG: peptide chain release factor N(5)-glutamine methyltransferase [Erythrobacter sp.]|nr:peptide chain release factor N(5)-glutamine methyltransferase [Erythrobacter sp.]